MKMRNIHIIATITTTLVVSLNSTLLCQAQTPTNNSNNPQPTTQEPETQVLVSEVAVAGVEGELEKEIYRVVATKPGKTSTKKQLQSDIEAIFATGYFRNIKVNSQETPLGVRVTFQVEPNPILRAVNIEGSQVLPPEVIKNSFNEQYNQILNLRQFQEGVKKINKWYQDNGYVLGQVTDNPNVSPEGTVTLQVAEGEIEKIQLRFLNTDDEDTDATGKPIRGKTQEYIVTREMTLKPGTIFNRNTAQTDLQRLSRLGIFKDLKLSLNPGENPRKVVLVVNATEANSLSLSPGGGYSSTSGLFALSTFQATNLGGRNQKLSAEIQANQRGLLFDTSFTDPWIAGDPYGTSYTISAFRRQTISPIFEGGDTKVTLANGDRPRVYRTGGSINFTRPLSKNPLKKSEWIASAGLQYQQVRIGDNDGETTPKDEQGNDLSFSGSGKDDLLTIPLSLSQDKRDNSLRPTTGSLLSLSSEQSIPVGEGNILYNKLRANYSFYIPSRVTKFTQGCRKSNGKAAECPQAFAFNIQGGTILGDLPPYQAFSLGGINSVRGFEEGNLGTARSFIQASAEYRFPMLSVLSGTVFFDAASDLGTGDSVKGNPAVVRGKPGSAFGYGLGLRVQSPLGPVRLDYGITSDGENRIQFGLGERF